MRLLGAGVTTAVALGIAASPAMADEAGAASAAGVVPTLVNFPTPDRGPQCPDNEVGIRAGTTTADYAIPGDGTLHVTVFGGGNTNTPQTFNYSVTGTASVDRVFVKGGGGTQQNLFDNVAAGFTDGLASDERLHAPVNSNNNMFYDLSHEDFCFLPSPYNGGS